MQVALDSARLRNEYVKTTSRVRHYARSRSTSPSNRERVRDDRASPQHGTLLQQHLSWTARRTIQILLCRIQQALYFPKVSYVPSSTSAPPNNFRSSNNLPTRYASSLLGVVRTTPYIDLILTSVPVLVIIPMHPLIFPSRHRPYSSTKH